MNSPWRRPDCCVASCWCNLKAGSVPKALICLQSHSRPRYTTGSTRRLCISSTSNALRSRREQVISTARSNSCVAPLNSNPTVGFRGAATTTFVETLLRRGLQADVDEAATAIQRLAAVPTEPGFVLFDVALLRLRALLARARGDEESYREFAERYRTMAASFGFRRTYGDGSGPVETRIHSPPTGYVKPAAAAPPDDRGSG